MKINFALIAGAMAVSCFSAAANAAFFTASDNNSTASITSAPNGPNTDLTIALTNLTPAASTTSAAKTLTGIRLFVGATNVTGNFTLQSQSGAQQFTFATSTTGGLDGGAPFDPSWAINTVPSSSVALYFDGFGSGGKPIIGPATSNTTYANANASLTAGPHGTYIYKTGTFVIEKSGSFNLNDITSVQFLFNTDGLTTFTGSCTADCGSGNIPEPASLSLLGLGAAGLLLRRRKA